MCFDGKESGFLIGFRFLKLISSVTSEDKQASFTGDAAKCEMHTNTHAGARLRTHARTHTSQPTAPAPGYRLFVWSPSYQKIRRRLCHRRIAPIKRLVAREKKRARKQNKAKKDFFFPLFRQSSGTERWKRRR